jgi:hypothetical protein
MALGHYNPLTDGSACSDQTGTSKLHVTHVFHLGGTKKRKAEVAFSKDETSKDC